MLHRPAQHRRVVLIEEAEHQRIFRTVLARAGLRAFRNREHSIGVNVKETSSDTAIAKADVKPNELMNRPTIPPMNPTGRNTASSESVVAITARPISSVP